MEQRKLQIPSGMQDTLPGECLAKRRLEGTLRGIFAGAGYQEIETPLLEYYDALDDPTWGYRPEALWKTFDGAGRILAVRPDTTIPAARMAAGALSDTALPLRLCYCQSATKTLTDAASLLCEETQCGVELMGVAGPQADAEVMALAVQCVRAAGLTGFQLEVGQARFVQGFLQEAGLNDAECTALRRLIDGKNALDMQLFLQSRNIPAEAAQRVMRLPRLYGDASVLDEAEALTASPVCREAIADLRAILRCLMAWGCADGVSIDLGMTQQANYYSGAVFRGLAGELGQPLLSGGRYDALPAQFGRDLPATGFALSAKLLLIAIERQGAAFASPTVGCAVAFDKGCDAAAIALAKRLREGGTSAAMMYGDGPDELQRRVDGGQASSGAYVTEAGVTWLGKAVDGWTC